MNASFTCLSYGEVISTSVRCSLHVKRTGVDQDGNPIEAVPDRIERVMITLRSKDGTGDLVLHFPSPDEALEFVASLIPKIHDETQKAMAVIMKAEAVEK